MVARAVIKQREGLRCTFSRKKSKVNHKDNADDRSFSRE